MNLAVRIQLARTKGWITKTQRDRWMKKRTWDPQTVEQLLENVEREHTMVKPSLSAQIAWWLFWIVMIVLWSMSNYKKDYITLKRCFCIEIPLQNVLIWVALFSLV